MPGMWQTVIRFIFKSVAILLGTGVLALFVGRLLTYFSTRNQVFGVSDVPARPVAVVFGAGLRWDGSPTPVLRNRVAQAADLYFAGKVQYLLMSGDNRFENYDEPSAMYRYAVQLGVPADRIVRDFAGRSTYDTCYRARDIFQVGGAILVTQPFHIPRALYICNQLGLDVVAVGADQSTFRRSTMLIWNVRETFATLAALWDVHIARPLPVLGNPEPIIPQAPQ